MYISNITNEYYEDSDIKELYNTFQSGMYCKFGCKLVGWRWDDVTNTLVHIVLRDDVFHKVHNLWCMKKLANMTQEDFDKWE